MSELASTSRAMARAALAGQQPVNSPVITQCYHGSPGIPCLVLGSPHVTPDNFAAFTARLRPDISLMSVRPARTLKRSPSARARPTPETCTPYVDATALGFELRSVLPLVFVRSRRAEPLLEARLALKYLRENHQRFASVLERIGVQSERLFRPGTRDGTTSRPRWLFQDVVQPYGAFTARHVAIRAGLWVQSPPGVSTLIGPPLNKRAQLSVLSGSIETDWHHFELFVVAEFPDFDGQVLVLEPDTTLAQMHFVARTAASRAQTRFSGTDPAAEPDYWSAWEELGALLVREGKGSVAERRGTASVDLGCPHCYASVTSAVDHGVPDDHLLRRGFNPAYKIVKREYHDPETHEVGK